MEGRTREWDNGQPNVHFCMRKYVPYDIARNISNKPHGVRQTARGDHAGQQVG